MLSILLFCCIITCLFFPNISALSFLLDWEIKFLEWIIILQSLRFLRRKPEARHINSFFSMHMWVSEVESIENQVSVRVEPGRETVEEEHCRTATDKTENNWLHGWCMTWKRTKILCICGLPFLIAQSWRQMAWTSLCGVTWLLNAGFGKVRFHIRGARRC